MKKSGLADSPFFASSQKQTEATPPQANIPVQKEKIEKTEKPKKKKQKVKKNNNTTTPRYHDTTVSRHQDTTVSRHQDTTMPRVHGVAVELVRKAVKEFGKEAATHRFTQDEKKDIAAIIYTYKNQGVKTSENEITRIAVNFVVEDYKENGENSVLHKILEALNE